VSLAHHLGRLARLRHLLGLRGALALQAAWTLGRPLLEVQVPGHRRPLLLRREAQDLSLLEQVFLEEDCAASFMSAAPRTIVEVGAHVGVMTTWFAERYPRATVIAVEPSADLCEVLRQNACGYPNVRVLHTALWSRAARLRVKDPGRLVECDASAPGSFEAVTLPDLLEQTTDGMIDLLKLDVDCAQRVLFSTDVDAWLDRVHTIVVEVRERESYAVVRSALRCRSFSERVRGRRVIFQRAAAPAPSAERRGLDDDLVTPVRGVAHERVGPA
jgi:FkbM family methyltransferase